ncbi:MAG: P1 family peptidase [Chloroflexi bacterium]|nr:P1 family peptidase [Chloroflexota bacterium]
MRLRDLGVVPGRLPAGAYNAITDVPGVRVGHITLIDGDGPLVPGQGPIRTGVTAVLPHGGNLFLDKVAAAVYTINGFGKVIGFDQVQERGWLETPILLTNTLNVGRAADALVGYMLRDNPDIGVTTSTVNPVVGECNDGFLNDIQGRHVQEIHVWDAIAGAKSGPVPEGSVGAGTGTACNQFKGGIGTASRRVLAGEFTVGALVQTNFGRRADLMVLGAPVGERMLQEQMPRALPGSIMITLATDAPLTQRQLERLARRAIFGLARTGAYSQDQSGDFVIAFSTTNRAAHRPDVIVELVERLAERARYLDEFFLAAAESVEEAIINAMLAAETMTGRDGNTLYALQADHLLHWLHHFNRI